MKIFLQRVRQAGASNSRSALFIIFATIFVLGAALPPARSKQAPQIAPTAPITPSLHAPSSSDYIVTTFTGASIVPGTTDTGNHTDDASTGITLPFDVQFYDQTFSGGSTIYVNSNGFLSFDSPYSGCCGSCLPAVGFSNVISVGWADLTTYTSGQGIFTSVSGVAPNRIFNIEWRAPNCCGAKAPYK